MKVHFAILILIGLASANTDKVLLLDSRYAGPEVSFQTFPSNLDSIGDSWHSETYPSPDATSNKNLQYFQTCMEDAEDTVIENWLLMPKFVVDTNEELIVEVGFTSAKCDRGPFACHMEVKLFANSMDVSETLPPKNWHKDNDWKFVGTLSALSKEVNGAHVQVFSYKPSQTAVYFGFKDDGTCTTLHYVKVYSTSSQNNWFTWENAKIYFIISLSVIIVILVIVGSILICCRSKKKVAEQEMEEGLGAHYGYAPNYEYDNGPLPSNFTRGITSLDSRFAMNSQDDDDGSIISSRFSQPMPDDS